MNDEILAADELKSSSSPDSRTSPGKRSPTRLRHRPLQVVASPDSGAKNFYKLADFDCDSSSAISFSSICEVSAVAVLSVAMPSTSCANRTRRANEDINKREERSVEFKAPAPNRASTVRDRIAQMFLNEHMANIIFEVGADDDDDIERIFAHKFVLAIGSAVFDAMFRYDRLNGTDRTSPNNIQIVRVADVELTAFVALLRFLYTDEAALTDDTVMATLYAAKKYDVGALEQRCFDHLRQRLSAENAFALLAQSRFFDEAALGAACLDAIDRDTIEALRSDGFLEIDRATLCAVFRRDELRINELTLFLAMVKWADEKCRRHGAAPTPENRRDVLGEAILLIRYTQMTLIEFGQHIAPSGVLSSEELVDVFLYFALAGAPPAPARPFWPVAPRWRFVGRRLAVNRFQRVETSWGYSGTSDRIKFQADNGIWLLGIGLYGSVGEPADYELTIEVIREDSCQTMAQRETCFSADGTPSIFSVHFLEPVEIAPTVTYIIAAKITGPESYYGTKGLRRIVQQVAVPTAKAPTTVNSKNMAPLQNNCNCSTITFYFSFAHGDNNGTSVDDGQIPQLIFSERL